MRSFFRLDDDHPFTGWHMLAVILLFFGVIISVNLVMAIAATGTFPGLVVKNSYVASQNYNELLKRGQEQSQSGRLEMGEKDGLVVVRLLDRDGVPLARLQVTAIAGRPSSTAEDRVIALAPIADRYEAAEALPPGQWIVEIEARRGEAIAFREQRRLYVRPETPR